MLLTTHLKAQPLIWVYGIIHEKNILRLNPLTLWYLCKYLGAEQKELLALFFLTTPSKISILFDYMLQLENEMRPVTKTKEYFYKLPLEV